MPDTPTASPLQIAARLERDPTALAQFETYGLADHPELESGVARLLEGVSSGRSDQIRFRSPQEIAAAAPETPTAVWDGYLYRGAVSILASKPKCGKSTLVLALVRAMVAGDETFLDRELEPGRVVFVSEEGDTTLLQKLPQSAQLRVLSRDGAWPKPKWRQMISAALSEAQRYDCSLIVIDTFAFWAQLAADKEKDAGAVGSALDELIEVASIGDVGVLLVHHSKKGGGADGESLRGSSAIAGIVDVILELDRPNDAPAHVRTIKALSRFSGTPEILTAERSGAGDWSVVEESETPRAADLRSELLAALQSDRWLTKIELTTKLGRSWSRLLPEVNRLVDNGEIERDGRGVKSSPLRFKIPFSNGVLSHHPAEQKELDPAISVSVVPALAGTQKETVNQDSVSVSELPERNHNAHSEQGASLT